MRPSNVVYRRPTRNEGNGDIFARRRSITWSSNNSLTLSAFHDIIFGALHHLENTAAGNLVLRADNTGTEQGQ